MKFYALNQQAWIGLRGIDLSLSTTMLIQSVGRMNRLTRRVDPISRSQSLRPAMHPTSAFTPDAHSDKLVLRSPGDPLMLKRMYPLPATLITARLYLSQTKPMK